MSNQRLLTLCAVLGALAPLAAQTPPSNVSMSPSSGTGSTRAFTFTASSPSGGAYIAQMQMLFNWGVWGTDSCFIQYTAATNQLGLLPDGWGNWPGPLTPGGSGSVWNSQCTLNAAASSVSVSGNNLAVTVSITFQPAFIGPQQAFMVATDNGGLSSGWQTMGTWTGYAAPYSQPPTAVSVTPSSGAGMSATFSFVASDLNGSRYMPQAGIVLGSLSAPNCTVVLYHDPGTQYANGAYLVADNGAWIGPVYPGGASPGVASEQNSRCTITGSGITASDSGNNWTYNLAVSFTTAFEGAINSYLLVNDHAGQSSGYQRLGTWTVAPQPALSISSAHSGNFTQSFPGAFTVTASNAAGAGATAGTVTVTENLPAGLTLASISGTGWSCSSNVCTRADSLAAGASFPSLTVNVSTAANAASPQVNSVTVSGGGSASNTGTDSVVVNPYSVTNVSVAPASGSGASQTFTLVYSDTAGTGDLSNVYVWFEPTLTIGNGVSTCLLYYSPSANQLSLYNDAGTGLLTPVTPGSSSSLGNSQCAAAVASTSVARNGNNLTLTLPMTFSGAFGGAKHIYMYAAGAEGNSGWQQMGSWTVPPGPPANTSLSPSSGTGATQSFTFTASSTGGGAYIAQMQMLFNWAIWGTDSCFIQYTAATNQLALLPDGWGNWLGPLTPGGSGSVSNSQCTLNAAGSSVSVSGNNLAVTVSITFQPAFIGPQQVGMVATDNGGLSSGWQTMGTWTGYAAPYSQPPTAVSVTPSSGAGMSATFSFVASDPNGAKYMPQAGIALGSSPSAPGCSVVLYHDPGTQYANGAYLVADNGAWIGPVYPGGGSPGVASEQNSQCTISGSGITASDSGNNWNYNLAVSFTTAFEGPINSYLNVDDHTVQTGYQQLGTWTVAPIESVSVGTNPAGLSFTADGITYTGQQTFNWAAGSQHTLTATSPQTAGAQYGFANWSDGSTANPHNITVPSAAASYTANFAPADFTLTVTPTANPSIAMAGGNAAAYTITVAPNAYFNDSVTLAANLPSGFHAAFGSATLSQSTGWQTTMSIAAPAGASGNISASLTATGSSTGVTHTATGGTLAIQDFTVTLSPSLTSVYTPGTANWTVTATGVNGLGQPTPQPIQLYQVGSVSNGTPYPSCSFSALVPNSVATGNSATVSASIPASFSSNANNCNNGNNYCCALVLSGSYGGTTHDFTSVAQLTASGFTLNPPGTQSAAAGGSTQFTLGYAPVGTFTGTVNFSVTGLPTGATPSYTPIRNGSTMTVNVAPGVPPNTYPLIITATQANCGSACPPPQIEAAWLTVSGGQTFSVTAGPTTATTIAPGATATYNVSVIGSYTGLVNLTTSGGPPGASITLSSYTAQSNGAAVTLTIATTSGTPFGNYATVVSASTSAGVKQFASAPLTVGIPTAAAIVNPAPGANITGGSTTFFWNAGMGATQYTITATPANGQPVSATVAAGFLSATLSLPTSSQTATVTLQTATAAGPLTQTYTYTIQPTGTVQPLTLSPGNPTAAIVANGQEYQYTFVYQNPTGAPRPSPQDITDCEPSTDVVKIRIVQLTANTATLGFTAGRGAKPADFDWWCDDGGGSGSGGGGGGTTSDPTPQIDSITPSAITAGVPTQVTIIGENFGQSQGSLVVGGTGGCSSSVISWSGTNGSGDTIQAYLTGSNPGYCTIAVAAATDDAGNAFLGSSGSSSQSDSSVVDVDPAAVPPPPNVTLRVTTSNSQQVPQATSTDSPSQCLYINPMPAMPAVTAQILDGNGNPVQGSATFSVSGVFTQNINNAGNPTPTVETWGVSGPPAVVSALQPWQAGWPGIVGGVATISWQYEAPGTSAFVSENPYTFCILGQNPSQATMQQTAAQATSPYWFGPNIAFHETNMSQFCDGTSRTSGAPYCRGGANVGMPIFGTPGGYGAMQLDTPTPTLDQIWDWPSNFAGGQSLIAAKAGPPNNGGQAGYAYQFWQSQYEQWATYNQNQQSLGKPTVPPAEQDPGYSLPFNYTNANCSFVTAPNPLGNQQQPGPFWFGDALLMKYYAGNGPSGNYSGYLLSWNNQSQNQFWSWNKGNGVNADIVYEYCTCSVPQGQGCQTGVKPN